MPRPTGGATENHQQQTVMIKFTLLMSYEVMLFFD
jgi:hypothetical protein